MWLEFELLRIENIVSGTLCRTNLTIKRFDKGTYGVNGRFDILTDFSDDWEVSCGLEFIIEVIKEINLIKMLQLELNIFYSAKGNNQFVTKKSKVM